MKANLKNGTIEMTKEEALAALENNQQKIDAVFGEGNAIYNPETNTIILVKIRLCYVNYKIRGHIMWSLILCC